MRSRFTLLLGALLALAVVGATPVAAANKSGGTYLALGDSVAAGTQQPLLFTDNAYPNVLFDKLEKKYGFDEFVNLACPSDDSAEMLDGNDAKLPGSPVGSFCYGALSPLQAVNPNPYFGADSQLAAALQYIDENPGGVRLITLTIGANDIFVCSDLYSPGTPEFDQCIGVQLFNWAENLGREDGIIDSLRDAAPGVPIVAMNYYNPDLAFWLTTPEAVPG